VTIPEQPPVGQVPYIPTQGKPSPHPVFWAIAFALAALAVAQFLPRGERPMLPEAFGQPVTSAGLRGVFAYSGQLTKNTYGIFMVDIDAMTTWAYEYDPQKKCLRLVAARTWRYDRYLENHNGCDLPPDVIEQMVEDQRQYRLQATESQLP